VQRIVAAPTKKQEKNGSERTEQTQTSCWVARNQFLSVASLTFSVGNGRRMGIKDAGLGLNLYLYKDNLN
jgi:hypothetical protein